MRRRRVLLLAAVGAIVVVAVSVGVGMAVRAASASTTLVVHLVDRQGHALTGFDDSVVVSLHGMTASNGFGVERYAAATKQDCYKHRCSPGWVGPVRGGVATFANLPSGQRFEIEAASGHEFLFHPLASFTVDRLKTRNVDYTVTVGGSISGTVRSAAGKPLGGIVVAAVDKTGRIAHRATTKDDGRYRIVGLEHIDYRVLFNAKPFGETASRLDYTPEYFRPQQITTAADQPTWDTATAFLGEPGVDYRNTNAVLSAGPIVGVHVTLPKVAAVEPTVLYFQAARACDSQSFALSTGLDQSVRLPAGTYQVYTFGPPARGQDGDDDTQYWYAGDGHPLVTSRAASVTLVVAPGSADQYLTFGGSRG